MSDSGDKPQWWVDGVNVGSGPERAPEPTDAEPTVAEPVRPESTPPEGIPAIDAPAAGTPIEGPPPDAVGAPGSSPIMGVTAVAVSGLPGGPPGPVAEDAGAPAEPGAGHRRRRWPIVVVALLVLVGIFLVVDFVFLSSSPKYTVSTGNRAVSASGSTVKVLFVVKNTGGSTGTPVCTVRIGATSGPTLGTKTSKEKPLDPGKSGLFASTINVTSTSAEALVTRAKIEATCT
jgi:hypothetical protein